MKVCQRTSMNVDFVELARGTGVVIKNSAISPSYFVSLTVARVVLLANNIVEKWEKRLNLSLVSPPVTTLRALFVMIKHYNTRQLLSIRAVMYEYIWAPHNWDLILIYIFQRTRDKLLESGIWSVMHVLEKTFGVCYSSPREFEALETCVFKAFLIL